MKKKCIAMLLAGGQGSRLGLLTKEVAKPAVPFGGKFRIIDFPLSNCTNSHIDTVGVLTQYQPLELNRYIGSGAPWDLDLSSGGVFILPPYQNIKGSEWYRGTANAIYQNISFIEQYDPEYVLILSGDHIYKMDYNKMLQAHIDDGADITIAVRPVPMEIAPSFGIMNVDKDDHIIEFEEKPKQPKSNLASMGVYIFNWKMLREYLINDENDPNSKNDFGKNIIPNMLNDKRVMLAYRFEDYWKDVGTIASLWEANMDLLKENPEFDITDTRWNIYARTPVMPPHYIGDGAVVERSMIAEGCDVYGKASGSVLFAGVVVEEGAIVEDSVIMPNTIIKSGAVVRRAMVAENCVVTKGCVVGEAEGDIALVGQDTTLPENYTVRAGEQVDGKIIAEKEAE
ncbi:MAG: glucose-1-phosphate adenylyltransferase [Clostridia bacterium]|nr:glucose-1-phosphate adenylyltransferase [Clostridia bacterium]